MDYFEQIFTRLNVQQIREFLMYGSECIETDPKGYKLRHDEARKPISDLLHQKFPEREDYDEVAGEMMDYVSVCQDIYMEIGLQCGFVIAIKMLKNVDKDGV